MNLSYNFNYRGEYEDYFRKLCGICKNLYNQALYSIIQELKTNNKWLSYYELDKLMKNVLNLEGKCNYYLLKSVNSQQCLRQLSQCISSYVKTIKDWKKHKNKYNGMPRFPSYKYQYSQLIYTNQSCSIKDGCLKLDKNTVIKIPQYKKYKDKLEQFKCVRIVPQGSHIKIEIIYNINTLEQVKNTNYASIDLGVNNLAALITNTGNATLYNGRQLKSKNQLFNKKLSHIKSTLKTNNNKHTSKKLKRLCEKRNNQINDLIHKTTTHIVKTLKQDNISMVAVGHNSGWKKNSKLSKSPAQAFQYIPFTRFINMLKYKCKLVGIEVVEHEESYTSKCDALSLEPVCRHESYMGRRVKRGLYQSSIGKLINADVNGAINILRKVVSDECLNDILTDRGLTFNPLLYGNLYELHVEH